MNSSGTFNSDSVVSNRNSDSENQKNAEQNEIIDSKLIDDSKSRGLTISANVSRILFDYFKDAPKDTDRILKL